MKWFIIETAELIDIVLSQIENSILKINRIVL